MLRVALLPGERGGEVELRRVKLLFPLRNLNQRRVEEEESLLSRASNSPSAKSRLAFLYFSPLDPILSK